MRQMCLARRYSVDVKLIKQLRAETKGGVMACRDALEASGGDLEKAKAILLSQVSANRDGREMGEGIVGFVRNDSHACAIHVSCETDFVSRGESVRKLLDGALEAGLGVSSSSGLLQSVQEVTEALREDAKRVTGEQIEVKNAARVEGPVLGGYVHAPSGFARIVSLVALEGKTGEESERAALKLAVQVCASAPESKESLLKEPFGAFGMSSETVGQVLSARSLKLIDFTRLTVGQQ